MCQDNAHMKYKLSLFVYFRTLQIMTACQVKQQQFTPPCLNFNLLIGLLFIFPFMYYIIKSGVCLSVTTKCTYVTD